MKLEIQKIRSVKTPNIGTKESAGIDFYIPYEYEKIEVKPGEDVLIPSGIKVNIPKGYCMLGVDKSGVSTKKKCIVGAKLIDSDYTGEVHLHIMNIGKETIELRGGEKVMQYIVLPVYEIEISEVDELTVKESERGEGGFGSTGIE